MSYLSFIWHPHIWHSQVQITDAGSVNFVQVDSRIDKDLFYSEAQHAVDQGLAPPQGILVNPIYLPAPHEVV